MSDETDRMLYDMGYGPERERENYYRRMNDAMDVAEFAAVGALFSSIVNGFANMVRGRSQRKAEAQKQARHEADKARQWRDQQVVRRNRQVFTDLQSRLNRPEDR